MLISICLNYLEKCNKSILSNSIKVDKDYWVEISKSKPANKGQKLIFIFMDDKLLPNDDEDLCMSIYFSNKLAYRGPVVSTGELYFSPSKSNKYVNIRLELYDIKSQKLTILQEKSSVFWNETYNFLYIVLPCCKENTYEVLFFPQESSFL